MCLVNCCRQTFDKPKYTLESNLDTCINDLVCVSSNNKHKYYTVGLCTENGFVSTYILNFMAT